LERGESGEVKTTREQAKGETPICPELEWNNCEKAGGVASLRLQKSSKGLSEGGYDIGCRERSLPDVQEEKTGDERNNGTR